MASPAAQIAGTLLFAALVAFLAFRRVKRNFGRQQLRPASFLVRLVLLAILTALLLPAMLTSRPAALAAVPALLAGVGLGVWAAQRTRFERREGQLYYVPHTYAGIVVTALFLGRLVYRLLFSSPFEQLSESTAEPPTPLAVLQRSPSTLAILFLLLGYNLYYYARILWKSRHAAPDDFEPS